MLVLPALNLRLARSRFFSSLELLARSARCVLPPLPVSRMRDLAFFNVVRSCSDRFDAGDLLVLFFEFFNLCAF